MGRSRDGGVEPRGVRRYAAARQPQAPRTVDTQRLTHRAQDVNTVKTLGRPPCAWAAEAQQALAICAHSVPATFVAQSPVRPPPPRDAKRGRPRPGRPPDQVVYPLEGALAMRVAARQPLLDHHRGVLLAPHERDATLLPPPEL